MALLLLGATAASAQIRDPIFGIPYDPKKVHFDTAPALVGRACPALGKAASQGALVVYAHLKAKDT